MKPFQFEVIATFNAARQQTFDLFFPFAPSEAQALTAALLHLSDEERKELCKFSFCQYEVGATGLLTWVSESTTQLKYYFGESGLATLGTNHQEEPTQ